MADLAGDCEVYRSPKIQAYDRFKKIEFRIYHVQNKLQNQLNTQ